MRTFNVNAHWGAEGALPEDTLMNVNQRFRRDDESLCTWFDDENRKGFNVSFDVLADDYQDAAQECLRQTLEVTAIEPLLVRLTQVGAVDESGILIAENGDLELLRQLPGSSN
jgi:hypothetical protein